jgi:hypothetical protein
MEFHTPDITWNTWFDSYEAFVKGCVIKGQFHPCVPENVILNYTVAEHIMAHSWYHYPMYDETLTTIVGIIEWSVKLKCQNLNILLNLPNENGNIKEKGLSELITELNKKEPGKHLSFHLEWARHLRNALMHPIDFGFSGATLVHAIREGVNILNQIFLPETLLLSFINEKQKMSSQMNLFSKGGWQLECKGITFLVEKCKITKAIKAKGKWHYLLSAYPLYRDFLGSLKQNSYQPMHLLDIVEVKIKQHVMEAKLKSGELVFLKPFNNELQKVAYQQHISQWQKADKNDRQIYQYSCSQDIELEESKMLYSYLHLVEN